MGRLFDAHSAEEAEFNHPTLAVVNGGQALQCVIQRDNLRGSLSRNGRPLFQRQPGCVTPSLGVTTLPCVVDQDTPHYLRRYGEEVPSVLPTNSLLVHEPEIGLVNQRRSLERVSGGLVTHVPSGHAAQLGINQRHQPVEGCGIAFAPGAEKLRYFLW